MCPSYRKRLPKNSYRDGKGRGGKEREGEGREGKERLRIILFRYTKAILFSESSSMIRFGCAHSQFIRRQGKDRLAQENLKRREGEGRDGKDRLETTYI